MRHVWESELAWALGSGPFFSGVRPKLSAYPLMPRMGPTSTLEDGAGRICVARQKRGLRLRERSDSLHVPQLTEE